MGTAGLATATVALARVLTLPPTAWPRRAPWLLEAELARPGSLRLSGPAAAAPGRWGVEYPGGWGEVQSPTATNHDAAERPFRVIAGDAPAANSPARMNALIWPDRGMFSADTGIDGHEVVLRGETGPLPAWVFPAGTGRRWAVLVHGRGAPRAQMLRLVPAFHAQGVTALVISYRNDDPACTDPSGRTHFGHREWRDLEVAVTQATGMGARELVLAGMSMGGGIIATFLRRSDHADRVIASVLDAPALNWGPILRHVARGNRVPEWLVPGVMATAALQARIDWSALNHAVGHSDLVSPVLLIHGDQDPVVPVELSDAYAAAKPERVTYLRVEGAGHVSAWNAAPGAYGDALTSFLQGLPAAL